MSEGDQPSIGRRCSSTVTWVRRSTASATLPSTVRWDGGESGDVRRTSAPSLSVGRRPRARAARP